MTYEEAEALARLIDAEGTEHHVLLTCAEDVAGELAEVPWENPVAEIQVIYHYDPGQWKLTRHDSCDVIGGETIDQAIIVSHRDCTVIAQNG